MTEPHALEARRSLSTTLALGRPRFADPRLARLAEQQGHAAAWAEALCAEPAQALAGVGGDFAVSVPLHDGRTVLAVDRFAVRTLCWRVVAGQLHVAERADTLAMLEPPASIDPQAIYDYLYFHVIPSPRTIFQGVHRLPPGHVGIFGDGRMRVQPYWTPRFQEPGQPDFNSLAERFREHVRQAVVGPGQPLPRWPN